MALREEEYKGVFVVVVFANGLVMPLFGVAVVLATEALLLLLLLFLGVREDLALPRLPNNLAWRAKRSLRALPVTDDGDGATANGEALGDGLENEKLLVVVVELS